MTERQALGKGLKALLPDLSHIDEKEYFMCRVDDITPSRYQPRKKFDQDKIRELAASIKESGIVEPLIVRRQKGGYEIIAGERRWRAAMKAGLKEVPVIVKEISPRESLELSLIENIQREDLNCLELATAYQRLTEEFSFTQETLSKRLGIDRSTIANHLRLLKLPKEIKDALMKEEISMGHAKAILGIEGVDRQREVYRAVSKRGLSVRETEAVVHRMYVKKEKRIALKRGDPLIVSLEDSLKRQLGTNVKIRMKKKGVGVILIEYYSTQELNRIIDILRSRK